MNKSFIDPDLLKDNTIAPIIVNTIPAFSIFSNCSFKKNIPIITMNMGSIFLKNEGMDGFGIMSIAIKKDTVATTSTKPIPTKVFK